MDGFERAKDNAGEAGTLADWRLWLEADDLVSPGLRESYRRTLEEFERFCVKGSVFTAEHLAAIALQTV